MSGLGAVLGHLAVLGPPAAAGDAPIAAAGGVYSEAQAARGLAVYERHCVICHAAGMTGGPGSPPLKGEIFRLVWESESLGALLEQIRSTMPTGQAGSLSDQQYADVLAAILEANGFPASTDGVELAADPAALANVMMGAPPE